MRFKSKKTGGFQVFAVAGVNTVSFAIKADSSSQTGLLGFAVERVDPAANERYVMPGYKVFESVIPNPDENTKVSTWDHPVQSFVWDDFTAKPDHKYQYVFHPLKGEPKNLDRSTTPINIDIRTEPLFSNLEHDIFFNRGVASSQAYVRQFGNKKPDNLPADKKKEALQWLSRELDEAMLEFVKQAGANDTLLCCFYEFRYRPMADALRAAITKGVDVQIIVDGKKNDGNFPRKDNLDMIAAANIPMSRIVLREAKKNDIQHNKFMVLLKGAQKRPSEVWTGSTNLSEGGIHGQTNVGHWVRNKDVAARFKDYWDLLRTDPGGKDGDSASAVKAANAKLRSDVEAINVVPTSLNQIQQGVTPVFSPRSGSAVLDLYVNLIDAADDSACITLAFGINKAFKDELKDNTSHSHIVFLLLEKKDAANPSSTTPYIAINASNNVYKAWGSYIEDPVYQWAKETNAKILQLNQHVSYVHSKFLLRDPLGNDPIVVTGSANFSTASTNSNDENMLIIRGDLRAADIYFTEFNRLFNHYYFRAVYESVGNSGNTPESLFLRETDDWLKKYAPGKLRRKRVDLFAGMKGFAP